MTPNAARQPMLSGRGFALACAATLLASAALRIVPAFGDFWLDEIWSWFDVRAVSGAWRIFDGIHDSNNHHLYSLYFYWLGERASVFACRIPSLVAGVASVAFAMGLAGRHGRLEALFAGVLTGLCFALIQFASEARGYSLAVGFALATTWLLERRAERPGPWITLAIAVCSILGFLAHLTFLFFLAGAFARSLAQLVRRREKPARALRELTALYAPALVAVLALTWIDLRVMRVGGGNPWDWASLASRTLGYSLGLPVGAAFAVPALALAALLGVAAGRISWRARDDDWLLVLVTFALAPALVLGVTQPPVVEVRYFVIGIALYLVLVSRLAAACWRAGGWRRAACATGLAVFVIGNAAHTWPFLRYGRGGYSAAVLFMAESTASPAFSVGSDHDYRNALTLRFYARALPAGRSLVYTSAAEMQGAGPDWVIVHAEQRPDPVPPEVFDRLGHRYRFARGFEKGGISGFWWGVYRKADTAAPSAAGAGASAIP